MNKEGTKQAGTGKLIMSEDNTNILFSPVKVGALPEREQRVVQHFGDRQHVSHDTNLEFEKKLTFGQRLADKVAMFGGSWTFIIIFAAILLSWVLLNRTVSPIRISIRFLRPTSPSSSLFTATLG